MNDLFASPGFVSWTNIGMWRHHFQVTWNDYCMEIIYTHLNNINIIYNQLNNINIIYI